MPFKKLLENVACVQLLSVLALCQTAAQRFQPSMKLACEGEHFLSVSVSSVERDRAPLIELELKDPSSRSQGAGVTGPRIPRSQYQLTSEVPNAPKPPVQQAIEVCGAASGNYRVTLHERGSERYRLTIEASDQENSEFLPAKLVAKEGRARRLRFKLKIETGQVYLSWVDEHGKPQLQLLTDEW